MKSQKLSDRQRELVDFMAGFHAEKGYPPTLAQMAEHLGVSSLNSVKSLLAALEKKGWIDRDEGVSRGVRLKSWEKAIASTSAFVQGRHGKEVNVGSICYWLGWFTHRRKPVLADPEMTELFHAVVRQVADEHDWKVESLALEPTHVRLAVTVGADHSPATVAHHFRRDSLGERIRGALGKQPLSDIWEPGFAFGGTEETFLAAMKELEDSAS